MFPMDDCTFAHAAVDFVVWAKTMVSYILGTFHLAVVWNGHGVITSGSWVVENPIPTRMIGRGELTLDREFRRQAGKYHIPMNVCDLTVEHFGVVRRVLQFGCRKCPTWTTWGSSDFEGP